MGLSSFASKPPEEVIAASLRTFFQSCRVGTRDDMAARAERARRAGAVGVIITLDWSCSNGRDWGSPAIPERIDLKTAVQYAPQTLARPRWLLDFPKSGKIFPDLTVPNLNDPDQPAPTFFGADGQWMQSPLPTWDDVQWLREQRDGPFMVMGITRAGDARRAADIGATAVSVSHHGGSNLDSTPATIRVLPAIAEAVGDQVEVVVDCGARRESDVVKAIAPGARAAMPRS